MQNTKRFITVTKKQTPADKSPISVDSELKKADTEQVT